MVAPAAAPDQGVLSLTPADEWRAGAVRNLASARTLAARGRDWVSVYYLTGFSVELMLKAVRMRRDKLAAWPTTDVGYKWHDLEFVAQRSQMLPAIRAESAARPAFGANWLTVSAWDPRKRYPPYTLSEADARGILQAAADPAGGVMAWLGRLYARS